MPLALELSLSLSAARSTGGGYLPQSLALFERMDTQPDETRKRAIDDFYRATADVLAPMRVLYIEGHDAQATRLNWLADEYNLTEVNSPVFTPGQGYVFNGSSSYLDTGLNPTTAPSPKFALNDAHMAVYAAGVLAAGRAGNTNSRIGWTTAPGIYTQSNNGTIPATPTLSSAGRLFSWDRTGSGGYERRLDAVPIDTQSLASTSLSNETFTLGKAAGAYGAGGIRASYFGSAMTAEQEAVVFEALQNYFLSA